MLGKLLKYDFRALSRVMLPLQGGVLAAGIAGSFLIDFSIRNLSNYASYSYAYDSPASMRAFEEMLNSTSTMLAILFLALVFASYWVTLFLIGRHLYKSFLKDEGYLSFTLPVTTTQNLTSKVIAGTIWLLINALILFLVVVLLIYLGFSGEEFFTGWFYDILRGIAQELSNLQGAVFALELLLLGLCLTVSTVLHVYVALIIGGVIAQTHKLLAGIGIYVAINIILQAALTIVTTGVALNGTVDYSYLSTDYTWFLDAQTILLPLLFIYLLFVAGSFILSRYLLHARLNLD